MSAPRSGDHGGYDELAVGWALHALEPEDEALFARHLPDCDRCARTVAETADVMAALATDLPQAEPSPDLRNRLRAAVERTEQVPPPLGDEPDGFDELVGFPDDLRDVRPVPARAAGSPPAFELRRSAAPRPAWRRALPTALVAAAVAAVLGLGTWNVMLAESRNQAQQQVAEQQQVVDSLLRPGQANIAALSDDDGQRLATVVARDSDVQVISEGLAVNDATRSTYVVWGMSGDRPTALGTFDVIRSQNDVRPVSSDASGLDDYPAYAVSIEPGRQMPDEPTKVVAQSQS